MTFGLRTAKISPKPSWWLNGVDVQLDFVNDRYFWNSRMRTRAEFNAFSLAGSCAMEATGLVLDGTAGNFDVSGLVETLGISFPCMLIASGTPTAVTAEQYMVALDDTTASNYVALRFNAANRIANVVTAGAEEAALSVGSGTAARTTIGAVFETNSIRQSINGATGGTRDTTATLPSITTFRVGERPGGTLPWTGTIHHIAIFNGTYGQATLNAKTALVHAL